MALTVEQLYEAYMDTGEYDLGDQSLSFAQDIYTFFGGEKSDLKGPEWESKYGMYLPTYDVTPEHFAQEEKTISYQQAYDVHNLAKEVGSRVYATEMEDLSVSLGEELQKGRQMAGSLGLRSGTLEAAVEDTMSVTSNKAADLGDRLDLQKTEDLNTYNKKMADATLDAEKSIHQNKKEFYNRTLAAIARLVDIGAFTGKCSEDEVLCSNGECKSSSDQCPGYSCEDQGLITCTTEFGSECTEPEDCPGMQGELTFNECEIDPTLPGCIQDAIIKGDWLDLQIQDQFKMCQADPSLPGCEGLYDKGIDLNLTPEDYNTATEYGEFNEDGSFTCHGNVTAATCKAVLTWFDDFDLGQAQQDLAQFIFGEGLGFWDDPQNPCYWVGDFPCTDARCTETVDENNCRSCDCPDTLDPGSGLTPGSPCTSSCSGDTPYQCGNCDCVASSDECSSGPPTFN